MQHTSDNGKSAPRKPVESVAEAQRAPAYHPSATSMFLPTHSSSDHFVPKEKTSGTATCTHIVFPSSLRG
jgi:hypothetical protein